MSPPVSFDDVRFQWRCGGPGGCWGFLSFSGKERGRWASTLGGGAGVRFATALRAVQRHFSASDARTAGADAGLGGSFRNVPVGP